MNVLSKLLLHCILSLVSQLVRLTRNSKIHVHPTQHMKQRKLGSGRNIGFSRWQFLSNNCEWVNSGYVFFSQIGQTSKIKSIA